MIYKLETWLLIINLQGSVVHILKLEQYREDYHGPCARMTPKFVKCFIFFGGAHGVMVIIVGNGHGDTSSNPGRDWLHFT